jgi:hypothetical protein
MPKHRVSMDIGGTFTDVIEFNEETGQYAAGKSSTTPHDLTVGVFEGLAQVVDSVSLKMFELRRNAAKLTLQKSLRTSKSKDTLMSLAESSSLAKSKSLLIPSVSDGVGSLPPCLGQRFGGGRRRRLTDPVTFVVDDDPLEMESSDDGNS